MAPTVFNRVRDSVTAGDLAEWPRDADPIPAGCLLDVLGIRPTHLGRGTARATMTVTTQHLNQRGVVQGGALIALADAVAGWATYAAVPDDHGFSTVELNANLVGSARDGDVLTATATPVHIGRSTVVVEVTVEKADGRPAARFRCTQLVLAR